VVCYFTVNKVVYRYIVRLHIQLCPIV